MSSSSASASSTAIASSATSSASIVLGELVDERFDDVSSTSSSASSSATASSTSSCDRLGDDSSTSSSALDGASASASGSPSAIAPSRLGELGFERRHVVVGTVGVGFEVSDITKTCRRADEPVEHEDQSRHHDQADDHDDRRVDDLVARSARRPSSSRRAPRERYWRGPVRSVCGLGAAPALLGLARACRLPCLAICRLCLSVHGRLEHSGRFGDIGEQGRRDSNPQPPVLETGALPVELLPSERGGRAARIAAASGYARAGESSGRTCPQGAASAVGSPKLLGRQLARPSPPASRAMSSAAVAPAATAVPPIAPAYARRRPDNSVRRAPCSAASVMRGERVAEQARSGLDVARAQQRERAQQPAVAGELGLAAQARLDVALDVETRLGVAVDQRRQQRRRPLHTAWASAPSSYKQRRAACGGPGAGAPSRPRR